ncbi:MAG TPA: hypothetical protein PKD52_10285 [Clostridiales bacterium]|nr:hypothetical protein [Clostridiales bacterium]
MSIASFFTKLFKKRKNTKSPSQKELLWIELQIPEDTPVLNQKLLHILAGYGDPLNAEAAVAELIDCGWERIKNDVYEMAVGKKPCLPVYFEKLIRAYPEEAAKLLSLCFEEMTASLRLVYLSVLGAGDAEKVNDEILALLPHLEKETLGAAFAVLAAYPLDKGLKVLASYLEAEDWKIKMKAASALSEANATQYIPAILKAAAGCDNSVERGLKEIAGRMGEN